MTRSHGADFEETTLGHFIVRDPRVRPWLKGEGRLEGCYFELTSWRREGLLARLRAQGFQVRTLDDLLGALPGLPAPRPLGPPLARPIHRGARYSYFDPLALIWAPVEPQEHDGEAGKVQLRLGWVVRQRRGRGAATYHQVHREGQAGAGLAPLSETDALLAGYAQAAEIPRPPLTVLREDEDLRLPDIELPPPHRELLRRLGQRGDAGWRVSARAWPLARAVYERLGLYLKGERV